MSLRKPFKRGPVWYCEVDRRRVSLKTKDKAEALSRFAEIRRRYLQQLAGTPIRSECLMTIGDFADEYMEWAPKAIKSPNTVNNAFIALKKLLAITKRSLPLSDVHPKHIDLLIAANRDRKSSSINCYIRFSRIVMNKAVSWGYIKENPFRSVK
ncbi:phage integrase SAM-like domain-containing protein [Bilophila wadsworthia]